MDITFVVTNYNYGQFIPRLMQSIIEQRDRDEHTINLIIGDDASADGSQKIIEEMISLHSDSFADVKLVLNETNGGKNNLLNQMLPAINTEYAVIVDADDWLSPEYLQTTFEEFLKHQHDPKFGFIYSDCTLCDQNEQKVGEGKSTSFSQKFLETNSYIPQTCLIRTEALKTCLPLDEDIRVGTKHHMWNKVCANGWFGKHIAVPLFFYRMHDKNISSIGKKILGEGPDPTKDRLLYGYWPTEKPAEP